VKVSRSPAGNASGLRGLLAGDAIDRVFAVGVLLKGLDGLLELIGGTLLLFNSPQQIASWLDAITREELAEDPKDFFATRLLHLTTSGTLTEAGLRFAGAYLIVHGFAKLVLVAAVLRERLWAYPWMIGFLVLFIGYQGYQIATHPSLGLIALTLLDIALVWLTYREWRRHQAARSRGSIGHPRATSPRVGAAGRALRAELRQRPPDGRP
jgi:uncharacterized membrane protein